MKQGQSPQKVGSEGKFVVKVCLQMFLDRMREYLLDFDLR